MSAVIGIDLGGTSAKAACLIGGKLKKSVRCKTSAADGAGSTAEALADLAIQAAEAAGLPINEAEAIGIGSPGVIDGARGAVVNWSNFAWKDVPLADLVGKRLKKPVYIVNDANAAALGEATFGGGKGYRDCVLLTLGTGVGSGIVLDGKLFEGYRGAGGEFGHTVIRAGGEACTCGRRGCFERYASATALIRMTREAMRTSPESRLWHIAGSPENVDGRTAFLAAREGDETAKDVISEYAERLGEGIVNIANLLRPQVVLLGGGISVEGEALLAPLRKFVYPRLYVPRDYAPFEIACASLGNDAGIYGAAQYALNRI